MRPARFADHLLRLVREDPQPTGAWSFAECGYTECLYGVVLVLPTGAQVYLQPVARPVLSNPYSEPEQTVQGPGPPLMSMPVLHTGPVLTPMVLVERYLGALLTASNGEELAELELYADREKPGSVPYGLTATFHNTAKIFLYARHCIVAGRQLSPGEQAFRRRDSI